MLDRTHGALALSLAMAAGASAEAPPLDLAALLREAEANNPEIAAARSRGAAAEAFPSQVEALPDPVASVSYTNVGLTDATLGEEGDTMLSLSWSQETPYPGKRRLAGDAARRDADAARRRLDLIRLDVISRIKQAFADLYRIDRSGSILGENREVLGSFMETARVRYESGEGLLQNVLKAQTEIARLELELEKLAQERRSVQAILNVLAGRVEDSPLGLAAALPEAAPVDAAELEQEALARSPELLEAEAGAAREEARLELARRQLRPDFVWGGAFMYRGDLDPEVQGSFGLRLPLYQRRKQAQGIVQAEHQLEAARQEAASVRLKVAAEVRDLAARASRAEALSRIYAEQVIPQARSALESASAAYQVGRVDFLTLLSDFSSLLGYEVDYEAERADRVSALAALERLAARELVPVGPAAREARP